MPKPFNDIPTELFFPPNPTSLEIRFRQAASVDMKPLHEACFAERPLAQFGDSFRRSLAAQEQGRRLIMVALIGSEIVATGQLSRFSGLVEIADLAVAPAYRGQGIGTALIQILEQVALFTGYTVVELCVMKGNHEAIALYKRLGFVEDRKLDIGPSAEVLVLRKALQYD